MSGIHPSGNMQDGPESSLFEPMPLTGYLPAGTLAEQRISAEMAAALEHAPTGFCTAWGIPFLVDNLVILVDQPITLEFSPRDVAWLIFMHTSDLRPRQSGSGGFVSPMRGEGQLGEHAADYVILFADGTEQRIPIRRRFQLGAFQRRWGENCFEAVAHRKPQSQRASHEQINAEWGRSQTRVVSTDKGEWVNWLWAWENPFYSHEGDPQKVITGIRFEPVSGKVIVSAVSAGHVTSQPFRWQPRQKALMTLPRGESLLPDLDDKGLLEQIQLDMGQVISATPRPVYPNDSWPQTINNHLPTRSENEVLIEYTAHPEACFHFPDGHVLTAAELRSGESTIDLPSNQGADDRLSLRPVKAATQRVTLRTIDRASGRPVPVKLHIHGEWGEYLAPIDRHRLPNPTWFEDFSTDFVHSPVAESMSDHDFHYCTYITGETSIDLPPGKVFIEIARGFEVKPVRTVVEVTAETTEIVIELEKVLPWRERGWVTADTHVHFLSPATALLEGAAEGVNVINLLASQWGELMTNVGDFDGKTTWGAWEAGGNHPYRGEHLVRVGTENRQHVLGHISLLGYSGQIIAPLASGGPIESALGDPVEVLLMEWARQCKKQGGLVVMPHFPDPRLENAAAIISGDIDAIEMTSWGNLYAGIDPYSLADWYRFLNCGYLVPAVGGTDKMSADTPVGAVRTYAHIEYDQPFTYRTWMKSIQRGETFVTYGPLLEFNVDGRPMGSRLKLPAGGGNLDVSWHVASATIPVSRVELIINGELRESVTVSAHESSGHWPVKIDESSWLALLVRGHYPGRPEIVAAHGTPVMVDVEGSPMLAAADAITILEQIEGALAYLDTTVTLASDKSYKRMRLLLQSSHRRLHNRMHKIGIYHDHTPVYNHEESN